MFHVNQGNLLFGSDPEHVSRESFPGVLRGQRQVPLSWFRADL